MRAWPLLLIPGLAYAQSGHGNLETGHPLSFDDAYSVGLGERTVGVSGVMGRQSGLRIEGTYGFALNRDITIGYDSLGDELEFSFFHGFRREIGDSPALAYRLATHIPREGPASIAVRGIATKAAGRYGKLHLNLDVVAGDQPGFGLLVGYSVPLGLPRHFDTVFLAEIGGKTARHQRPVGVFGLGLRHQLSPTTVLDIGGELESTTARFVAGWSVAF